MSEPNPPSAGEKKPDFRALLEKPVVPLPLPADFDKDEEAAHLDALFPDAPQLEHFSFGEFIHAGGSAMVFRVVETATGAEWATKIARRKPFEQSKRPQDTKKASPLRAHLLTPR